MTKLTEQQAWKVIADAYATKGEYRTFIQTFVTRLGICVSLNRLYLEKLISFSLRTHMNKKIVQELNICRVAWFFPVWEGSDKLRADYCYFNYYMLGGK